MPNVQLKSEKADADAYAAKLKAREDERVQFALWKLFHLEARVRKGEVRVVAATLSFGQHALAWLAARA